MIANVTKKPLLLLLADTDIKSTTIGATRACANVVRLTVTSSAVLYYAGRNAAETTGQLATERTHFQHRRRQAHEKNQAENARLHV